jgi:outer membrane protein OmpA-like peptidoglycan-associated protein
VAAPSLLSTKVQNLVAARSRVIAGLCGDEKVILFDFGRSDLTSAGQVVVNEVLSAALADPTVPVSLVGHADTVGDTAYNQRLSQSRTETVRNALISGV